MRPNRKFGTRPLGGSVERGGPENLDKIPGQNAPKGLVSNFLFGRTAAPPPTAGAASQPGGARGPVAGCVFPRGQLRGGPPESRMVEEQVGVYGKIALAIVPTSYSAPVD